MAAEPKGVLLFQLAQGLPFYSQVTCSRHARDDSSDKFGDVPEGKTLFLRSLDPLLHRENISRGLERFGNVEVRVLPKASQSDPGRSECSSMFHAIIDDDKTANKLLADSRRLYGSIIHAKSHKSREDSTFLSVALQRRRGQYRGMDILQKNADERLVTYDVEEYVSGRLEREVTVDDEGFTLVTQGPEAVKAGAYRRPSKRSKKISTTTVEFYRYPNKEKMIYVSAGGITESTDNTS
ncbi:ribosomal RNA-processing 7, putative [Babesia ovata]|uniref:Ribosomal RNA-processing 7, putative n=1 Tax=Babesia ovata TaxID=189622 RepID=A0A2H6K7L6_9APIC|nr:ribosomal RNA-processing 7, putative [Babesia ovata]GBE58986.1 ribosomal RNA-processing 7, putative [Babesia ovata]